MFVRVVLLPLRRYKATGLCSGLILIPAGPGFVRRIGFFHDLCTAEIEDVMEREITIV
jgi:hypothetical protein